jgi:hypothetical protein
MSSNLKPVFLDTENDMIRSDKVENVKKVESVDNLELEYTKSLSKQSHVNDNIKPLTTDINQRIFRPSDSVFIPDFSDRNSTSDVKSLEEDVQYHHINLTKNPNNTSGRKNFQDSQNLQSLGTALRDLQKSALIKDQNQKNILVRDQKNTLVRDNATTLKTEAFDQRLLSVETMMKKLDNTQNIATQGIATQGNAIQGNSTYLGNQVYSQQNNTMNNDNSNEEYVTKTKLSSTIGEMRVDILSMVNLLNVLNKNVQTESDEIQAIKRDIFKLVNENTHLKEKLIEQKRENDRRYNSICQTYDKQIMDITNSISTKSTMDNIAEKFDDFKTSNGNNNNIRVIKKVRVAPMKDRVENNSNNNNSNNDSTSNNSISNNSTSSNSISNNSTNTKVSNSTFTKTTNTDVNTNTDTNTKTNTNTNTNTNINTNMNTKTNTNTNTTNIISSTEPESKTNSIIDSNVNVNAKKYKSAKPRARKNGMDSYGSPKPIENERIITQTSRQTSRRDAAEEKISTTTDTKSARANRLGLQQPVTQFADKAKLAAESKVIRAKRLGIVLTSSGSTNNSNNSQNKTDTNSEMNDDTKSEINSK